MSDCGHSPCADDWCMRDCIHIGAEWNTCVRGDCSFGTDPSFMFDQPKDSTMDKLPPLIDPTDRDYWIVDDVVVGADPRPTFIRSSLFDGVEDSDDLRGDCSFGAGAMESPEEEEPLDLAPNPRAELLRDALAAVNDDRNRTYGSPVANFTTTADALTALGFSFQGVALTPASVAIMMATLKLARLVNTPGHRDSWVDLAGYAACGFEASQ